MTRWRLAAWVGSGPGLGLAVVLAIWRPSDVVYWLIPLLCAPFALVVGDQVCEPFKALSMWKQRAVIG